jgi:hypothetical protein
MGNIKNASRIDISRQNLTVIPSFLYECKNLQFLNLSQNCIKEIPIELSRLKRLKVLDLSGNAINHIKAKTFDLQNLEVLNLSRNYLKSLPKQIANLKKLKKLILDSNQLEFLPKEIEYIKELKQLNITDNKFVHFPEVILSLENLTHLWIGKNNFHNLPINAINEKLISLKTLYTFNYQNSYEAEKSVSLLMESKGNTINTLKLLTYKDHKSKAMKSNTISKATKSKKIFISYSHKDIGYKDEVVVTLKGLKNISQDLEFDYWADDRIKAGNMWEQEIINALENSSIAILIASRNFIASDFIMKTEVPKILENAEKNGVLILTIVAGASILNNSPIGKFQWINTPNKPLNSLPAHEQDAVYNNLANRVADFFNTPY